MAACKTDVKNAILNKVYEEIAQGRYTFTRIGVDEIRINGRSDSRDTRALSRPQAIAIAREVKTRVEKSFNNHVSAIINDSSIYDPISITFTPSQAYVDHEFGNLKSREEKEATESLERMHVLTDTGFNTFERQNFSLSSSINPTGIFDRYLKSKYHHLSYLRERLQTNKSKQLVKGLTAAQATDLRREERKLKTEIEGHAELGIKGLEQEIADLEKETTLNAVSYYVTKDMERLDKLAKSGDERDIKEAWRIVQFYTLAGSFSLENENPFFSKDEIFEKDPKNPKRHIAKYLLHDSVREPFEKWAAQAQGYKNQLIQKEKEIVEAAVNEDFTFKNVNKGNPSTTYEDLTYKETGLKDADIVSMWLLDTSSGLFSHNGILPQVIFSTLTNSMEAKLAWHKGIVEEVDAIARKAQDALEKLDNGAYTLRGLEILGLGGASYQVYKEITKEGNETGGLVQRYTPEFYKLQQSIRTSFYNMFHEGVATKDYTKVNRAFAIQASWRRLNTVVMDFTKLEDIANDPEFASFAGTIDANHKAELINLLGQKGYDEQVQEQKRLLREYTVERVSIEEELLEAEGKLPGDTLSPKGQGDLSYWESRNHPKFGIEDYHSVTGRLHGNRRAYSFGNYNLYVPRKNQVTITANNNTGQYDYSNTNTPTNHYSEAYSKIENDEDLYKLYKVAKEVCEKIKEVTPYEIQKGMAALSLPGLEKVTTEIISDNKLRVTNAVVEAAAQLWEKLRLNMGVVKQSTVAAAITDPATGLKNYKVNDGFLTKNKAAIDSRRNIETIGFIQAYNSGVTIKAAEIRTIKRQGAIAFSKLTNNPEALLLLARYLHQDLSMADIQAKNFGKLTSLLIPVTNPSNPAAGVTDYKVEIGRLINDYATHTVVQSQSFDLPKLLKYFSNLAMVYSARQEALPLQEILKKHYEGIRNPTTNNLGEPIFNVIENKFATDGLRARANEQMEDEFQRRVLGNYGTKQFSPFSLKLPGTPDEKALIGKTIYSREDREKLAELRSLLANEEAALQKATDAAEIEVHSKRVSQLQAEIKTIGKTRTLAALFEGWFSWMRILNLAWNIPSAIGNFAEGVTSNVIIAADGEYMSAEGIFYGYTFIKSSFIKSLTAGKWETKKAKKLRHLMDLFDVLIDSANELQKSSKKGLHDKLSWASKFEVNHRTEYINQSPLLVGALYDQKIKDENGKEHRLIDAYNEFGKLKDTFKKGADGQKNVENWEQLTGEDYLVLKQKLRKVIGIGHGLGYDEMRGMKAKSHVLGKALTMFKTWLPAAIQWRLGEAQSDLQAGRLKTKGRYRSHTATTAALHGGVLGMATFGPIGGAVGLAAGATLGWAYGLKTNISVLKATIEVSKELAKKMIGIPVNMSKAVIPFTGKHMMAMGKDGFKDWVSKGEFTDVDAMNMRANMADIAVQLWFILMIVAAKALLWDDDDDPKGLRRESHNVIVNKITQMSTQAAMYTNPNALYKSLTDMSTLQNLTAWTKEIQDISKWVDGEDTIAGGVNSGKSKLGIQTRKLLMPGIFKDNGFGFKTLAEREFAPSPFQKYFDSDEKKDKRLNKSQRAARRSELNEQYPIDAYRQALKDAGYDTSQKEVEAQAEKMRDKDVRKILDQELPTTSKLKKYGLTRQQYNEAIKQAQ